MVWAAIDAPRAGNPPAELVQARLTAPAQLARRSCRDGPVDRARDAMTRSSASAPADAGGDRRGGDKAPDAGQRPDADPWAAGRLGRPSQARQDAVDRAAGTEYVCVVHGQNDEGAEGGEQSDTRLVAGLAEAPRRVPRPRAPARLGQPTMLGGRRWGRSILYSGGLFDTWKARPPLLARLLDAPGRRGAGACARIVTGSSYGVCDPGRASRRQIVFGPTETCS